MAVSDESDWEYEYDENETETFYLTLDLTTHVPPVLVREKRSIKGQKPTARGSNKSLANAPGVAEEALDNENEDENQDDNDNATAAEGNRMQIVDLHAENPLISYNNNFYSCRWATELGTNLFLAPPPTAFDPNHVALRSTPSFDILGTTSARLVAIPATIRPRADSISTSDLRKDRPLTGEQSYTTAEGDVIQSSETHGLRIELPSTASAARVSQAKFLESLSAIKARRGDRDAVPVTNVKTYRPPEGWQDERNEWIAKETGGNQKDIVEAAARMERLKKRPRYARVVETLPESQESVDLTTETGARADADADARDTQEPPSPAADAEAPDPAAPRAQAKRNFKRTRGGPRGGAPSGKRLRESLGLPEARRDRDKRPRGRPRKSVAVEAGEGASAAVGQGIINAHAHAEQVDVLLEGAEDDQEMRD